MLTCATSSSEDGVTESGTWFSTSPHVAQQQADVHITSTAHMNQDLPNPKSDNFLLELR